MDIDDNNRIDEGTHGNGIVAEHEEELDEEQKHFLSVIAAFKCYRVFSMGRLKKTESYLHTLPPFHQQLLEPYREHLTRVRHCIDENYEIIRKLYKGAEELFGNSNQIKGNKYNQIVNDGKIDIREQDLESPVERYKSLKVQVTLKQLARDWSSEGAIERDQCYKPIIDAITDFFKPSDFDISQIKILVPGAGLGRLIYELAYRGYYCEGNEFSFYMLIASNFVLNKCLIANQYTIYPWVLQFVNNVQRKDQVHAVEFPDVSPTQAPPTGILNMVAGDFLEVYTLENSWDCVATCFFIDCANNVTAFIENIYKILKPGGIWINLGPLLYHYSDMDDEDSIEPSYQDIKLIIRGIGFTTLKSYKNVKTKYAQNPRSMQRNEYFSVFFVCQKPNVNDEEDDASINKQHGQQNADHIPESDDNK